MLAAAGHPSATSLGVWASRKQPDLSGHAVRSTPRVAYPAYQHPLAPAGDSARSDGYRRHRPADTVLYQSIAEHWPEFRARMEEEGELLKFVVKEFDQFLDCGILERGCLLLECRDCGHRELVAFSCKRRGFCCSCIGRRMADLAVHLEQQVLPQVPIRHWICSLPWGLRALVGYDRELCAQVLSAFVAELSRSLKWRAKKEHGLTSVANGCTGAVAAVQRVDSALLLRCAPNGSGRCILDGTSHARSWQGTPPWGSRFTGGVWGRRVLDIAWAGGSESVWA
jgi:hypothetical protein